MGGFVSVFDAIELSFVTGDVIVDINGSCVLGHTHADVVQMFQLVPVNQYVNMTLCRGYPLPDDNEDPVVDIVTATPIINGPPMTKGDVCVASQDLITGTVVLDQNGKMGPMLVNGRLNGPSMDTIEQRISLASSGGSQPELVTIPLVKGPKGFGFAIADSPTGQKVKMILDSQWCQGLQKGDVIKEICHQNVQSLTHLQVVEVLKQFPVGAEVPLLILRGGTYIIYSCRLCAFLKSLFSVISKSCPVLTEVAAYYIPELLHECVGCEHVARVWGFFILIFKCYYHMFVCCLFQVSGEY